MILTPEVPYPHPIHQYKTDNSIFRLLLLGIPRRITDSYEDDQKDYVNRFLVCPFPNKQCRYIHRSRSDSSGLGLLEGDLRLSIIIFRRWPIRELLSACLRVDCGVPDSRSPAISSSRSRDIGSAADDDLLTVSAAWACTSSSLSSSRYGSYRGLDGAPRARDRTTSPLQIGHVRRRVVSQGVLQCMLIRCVIQKDSIATHMQSTWNSWPHGRLIT
jgi:hypothetical protein